MALIRNPLKRNTFVRVNDRYDRQDIVIENAISQKRQFKDVDNPNLLTQNNWNMSPFTRVDAYRDLSIGNQPTIGRYLRYPGTSTLQRFHTRQFL